MKKAIKSTKKREFFILEEWLPALQKLDGFSLLAVEFKKNTNGFVKKIKGQVFEEYEKYPWHDEDSREATCLGILDLLAQGGGEVLQQF